MPEFDDWRAYFRWLDGGKDWAPRAIHRMVNWPDAGHSFTAPELRPEWFDESYAGRVEWEASDRTVTPKYSAVQPGP